MVFAKIVDLWRESVVMQSVLAIVVLCTLAYLTAIGRPVDDQWWALAGLVVGYYFGSDRVVAVRRILSSYKGDQR